MEPRTCFIVVISWICWALGQSDTDPCACAQSGLPTVDGVVQVRDANDKTWSYPIGFGESCSTWDLGHPQFQCDASSPNAFCDRKWCFVNPKTCRIGDMKKTTAATGNAPDLVYSYMACCDVDLFTSMFCTSYYEAQLCKAPCVWDGTHCWNMANQVDDPMHCPDAHIPGICQDSTDKLTFETRKSGFAMVGGDVSFDSVFKAWDQAGQGAGYCKADLTSMVGVYNSRICGSDVKTNLAYKAQADFCVEKSTAWRFRLGTDFGRGGVALLDWKEKLIASRGCCGDCGAQFPANLWWSMSWNNDDVLHSKWVCLHPGRHSVGFIGFEDCCDGAMAIQVQENNVDAPWRDLTLQQLCSMREESCSTVATPHEECTGNFEYTSAKGNVCGNPICKVPCVCESGTEPDAAIAQKCEAKLSFACLPCIPCNYGYAGRHGRCERCPDDSLMRTTGLTECEMCPENQKPDGDRWKCVDAPGHVPSPPPYQSSVAQKDNVDGDVCKRLSSDGEKCKHGKRQKTLPMPPAEGKTVSVEEEEEEVSESASTDVFWNIFWTCLVSVAVHGHLAHFDSFGTP